MDSLLSVCGKSESIKKKIIFLKPHLIVYIFAFSDTLVSVRNVILVTVRTVVWVGVVKLLIQSVLNCNQLSCNFRLHGIFCTAMFVVMVMVLLLVVVRMGGGCACMCGLGAGGAGLDCSSLCCWGEGEGVVQVLVAAAVG